MRDRLVIGHRGAAAHAPENTLLSFETAWKMGADMVELDIQFTSDGQIVCAHDYDLSRICGLDALIHDTDYDTIRSLDAGRGEHIPLLSEVLDFCKGKVGVNIEIKEPGVEEPAYQLVQERHMLDDVLFSSFFHDTLRNIRAIDSKAKIGILYNDHLENTIQYATDLKANAINPLFFTITPELVEEAHKAGIKVYAWTVNDEDMMEELLKIGVDGLITDLPDLAARVVDAFLLK
ncbi:MAG: glycerophosphodiester phosphodiesterase [Candidatus Thorarchaeota archaeon]